MKVSDYVVAFLALNGVTHVFEVVGGMITHLVDSLYRQGKIRVVSVHHEQAAAFAADAFARMTGVPGVALATSGPGATNLLTGIGSCYFDSVPAVFLTGQVNRAEQKGDRPVRQLGFQETDILSMAQPITKAGWRVQNPEDVPALLREAFAVALSGRRGPVLLDIPMDVQRATIDEEPVSPSVLPMDDQDVDPAIIHDLLDALDAAERPLILIGGGIRSARVADLFRSIAEYLNVPVVNSLMAVDVLPHDHPLRVGMIGTYGNRWANLAVGRSDFLLVLGSRLDIRQTGSDTAAFSRNRVVYHIDCDPPEMNNRVVGCRTVESHLRPFLGAAIQAAAERRFPKRDAWQTEIDKLRRAWPDTGELQGVPGVNPNEFMHQLSAASRAAAAFIVDVGNHQMWAAQSLDVGPGQRFITSGGMGAMGFALPAAVGAAFACAGQPVVMVAGDGGFQLNAQELQTVAHHHLPIKIVILNNQSYGMVRQFQQSYFGSRYQSTQWGYSAPDFARVARAYGIDAMTLDAQQAVESALDEMWRDPTSPLLLQVIVDSSVNAYPKIAFGRPITEMEPIATPLAMEGS